jgi:hypothetical protein
VGLAFIAILWFPLKVVTASIWAGHDAHTIVSNVLDYFGDAMSGGGKADTTFLDQAASTITLVDANGELFYGKTVLPLLVSPVPRLWWPDKPHMNEYQYIISTPGRPMSTYGSIATLVGEGYANFSYLGGVIFPMLAAYLYGRAYFAAIDRPHNSVFRFLYLVIASTLLQVYRDGFIAAFLFPISAAMPMMAVGIVHFVFAAKGSRPPIEVGWMHDSLARSLIFRKAALKRSDLSPKTISRA